MKQIIIDQPKVVQNLSAAIQIATVTDDICCPPELILQFHKFLEKTFPLVASKLKKKVINGYSLLYTLEGFDKMLDPNIYMGHMDVVPAGEEGWDFPAFSGAVENGYIYGRGTLDIKNALMASLEAVEALLREGFQPNRTLILAFGHDEETGGYSGAKKIVKYLSSHGIHANMVLDEGNAISDGIIPGFKGLGALVGIAEKGYLTFELSAKSDGGHSSMPEGNNAIEALSEAICSLTNNQMEAEISKPVGMFLNKIKSKLPFMKRLAISNLWVPFFKKAVIKSYQKSGVGKSLISTTIVPTMANAGTKENIVPENAKVTFNCRILPGKTVEDVVEHVRGVINNPAIKIEVKKSWNPSPISLTENTTYQLLEKAIYEVFFVSIVAPSLTVAITDSRYYNLICDNVYKFSPVVYKPEDVIRVHGKNERISVEAYEKMIQFYALLMMQG
jgi:carboxypeptidase PM20D1